MNKSDSIAEIAGALAKAQSEIANAHKKSVNPHFRSSYADLAEVLNTVRPVFASHDMSVIQAPEYGDGIVTVETMITHSSGEWIASSVSAPVSKQDAQGVGSAITYCRRYGLAAMAGIAQEDDDGNGAVQGPGKAKAKATDAQVKTARDQINACESMDAMKKIWQALSKEEREALEGVKEAKKQQLTEQEEAA